MKYRNQTAIKERLVCWITAAMLFFCAVVPVSGLCVCDDCPYANSTHSDSPVKNSAVPSCCQSIGKTVNSEDCKDEYCSCNCASLPTASISVSNGWELSNELKNLMPIGFFLSHITETTNQLFSCCANVFVPPILRLSVRLHLLLSVLLN
ncbi:MAG: hypothetical protein LBQ50_05450 [Planctomycetaceae bacterium]|jgi:hypothetical protein|nr:hypothetical protein [Planctomycetaceae bacterium]